MTREEKANMIESIKTNLNTNSTIYLTDCSGLDADTTSKLRRACFKSNIKMLFCTFFKPYFHPAIYSKYKKA